MNRIEAIETILKRHPQALVVLSNGLTAREAAALRPEDRCLYLLHAMGEAYSVGLGVAQARPDAQVVVIDGDGNALMGLAAWCNAPPPNLTYYVLQNGSYQTTGGQPLPDLPWRPDWCTVLPIEGAPLGTPNPPPPEQIWKRVQRWLASTQGA